MDTIKFSSIQSPNMEFICEDVTAYIADRLKLQLEFVNDISWQERERLLDAGEIQACWICGLPYIWKADLPTAKIELLAAPVFNGERYEDRPVYFSDVVVQRDSTFETFADLRGTTWAFNEPGSHSGYLISRYHLATLGEKTGYFGRVVESGSHQTSLRMIIDGEIDASAIDSTVLEQDLKDHPEMTEKIRIIDALGPSPMPPWVVSTQLSQSLRTRLREAFLTMHEDEQGRELLSKGNVLRFAYVTDSFYDAIRDMEKAAEGVSFT